MSNALKKITARAKQIHRRHPRMKWTAAISQASKELKRSGSIGNGSPQVSGHKKRTTKRRAKPSQAKRTVSPAPPRAQFENESISSLKSRAKKILKDQLGRKLAQKSLATGKRVKKKLGKEASAIRAQIIKFN
jgi:hypothetical protein